MVYLNEFGKGFCFALGLLTVYSVNASAKDFLEDFINSSQSYIVKDNMIDPSSSMHIDNLKDFSLFFDNDFVNGNLTTKVGSDSKSHDANLKLGFNQFFNPNIKVSNLESDIRNFAFSNKSSFSGMNFEQRVFLNNDFELKSFEFGLSISSLNVFSKFFNEELRTGNLNYVGINPFKGISFRYGSSSFENKDKNKDKDSKFTEILLNRNNMFLSGAKINEKDIYVRGGLVKGDFGLVSNYKSVGDSDSLEVVLAIKPKISKDDFVLIDNTYFKNEGSVGYKALKSLSSFMEKGFALRYYENDTFNEANATWNFLNLDIQRLNISMTAGLDYNSLVPDLKENISISLGYGNLKFSGKVNNEEEINASFSYEIKF